MIKLLRKENRLNETIFMALCSIICLVLSLVRVFYTGHLTFLFLNWNLFLAFVPWLLSSFLIVFPQLQLKKIAITTLIATWLLFFPNAPYIFTDLFHLKHRGDIPAWYDLMLIISFAWTGLVFGFLSLLDIERILSKYLRLRWVIMISLFLLLTAGFGVYIGRFLRWNSWDMLYRPFTVFSDLIDRFIHPTHHLTTWGLTLFMGLFLNMVYWTFRLFKARVGHLEITEP